MKIVIVGAGAMGCLFAGMLSRAGFNVWLLEKINGRAEVLKKNGLLIEQKEEKWHIPFDTITANSEEIGTADIVIIFVKAYDTSSAVKNVYPVVSEKTTVLTLQNGLGNVEKIRDKVPEKQIIAGTTAHGSTLLGVGHARHAGIGETVIGAINASGRDRVQSVKDIFEKAGISTAEAEDINNVLWGKLLVNVGINPLTAIMRIRNGQILDFPPLTSIMKRAVNEGLAVAGKLGISVPFPDPVKKVEQVCRATSENISSMHQDINAGKKTEIAQINGAVVRYGKKVNIPVPVNSFLTGLVQSMEQIC